MKEFWKKRMAGEQRGAFIVFTALAVWFLMMFVAFAVDFGNLYYHKARLQNAADAAALAGVARYVEGESGQTGSGGSKMTMGKGRLIGDKDVPADNVDSAEVEDFIKNNYEKQYGSLNQKEANVWTEQPEKTQTEDGKEITTTHHYCKVYLKDKIPTFFARIFGLSSLDVEARAVAMLDGMNTKDTVASVDWAKVALDLVGVAGAAPNFSYETLRYNGYKGFKNSQISGDFILPYSDEDKDNNRYVNSDDYTGVTKSGPIQDEKGYIIGYREPEEGEGIWSMPIYLTNNPAKLEKETDVVTNVYNLDSSLYGGKNIFALFLDRDNIMKAPGWSERFTRIDIGSIGAGAGENKDIPLYVRVESEPPDVGNLGRGLTTVCRIDITLDTNLLDQVDRKNPKPVVIIYEGPTQIRGDNDAPWIPTERTKVTAKNEKVDKTPVEYSLRPGQMQHKMEALLNNGQNRDSLAQKHLVQNCMRTSAPVFIHIPPGYTFNGIVYMPRSRVEIIGEGQINGFILAKEIIGSDGQDVGSSIEVSLPTLSLVSIENKESVDKKKMTYKNDFIEGPFKVLAGNLLDGVDYTDNDKWLAAHRALFTQ